MRLRRAVAAFIAALPCIAALALAADDEPRRIPLSALRSGITFAGSDVQAMQKDDFENPAMLWVEKGERLWMTPAGPERRSCQGCHGDAKVALKGVAASYPKIDAKSGKLLNVEGRINQCRVERQQAPAFRYESEELIGLTAFVANQSRGVPLAVSIDGPARPHFEAGKAMYYRRVGQVNLSCANCHEQNWGRTLLAERISQGHPNAYPIYRLEWQTAGSLHRRFRSCLSGVRAEMLQQGAPEYLDLELFLAWRAQGLPIETPGVRR